MFVYIGGSDELRNGNQNVASSPEKEQALRNILNHVLDMYTGAADKDIIMFGKVECPFYQKAIAFLEKDGRSFLDDNNFKAGVIGVEHDELNSVKAKHNYEGTTPLVWVKSLRLGEFLQHSNDQPVEYRKE